MSYYDKYLKYKTKYIQYKNKLGINNKKADENDTTKDHNHIGGDARDIFAIDKLSDTPMAIHKHQPKVGSQDNMLSIEMLTNTPRLSDFVGGAYKPNNKQNIQHNKLLKLLEADSSEERHDSHTSASAASVNIFDLTLSTRPRIKDSKSHRYFGQEETISPSSTSSSSSSI